MTAIVFFGIGATPAMAGSGALWDASSGLLPDATSPPWTLSDSAIPEDPVLGPSFLTLETSTQIQSMLYLQEDPLFQIDYPLTIEVRMRIVSGTTAHAARGYASVNFTVAPDVGNQLHFRTDEIFLSVGHLSKGTSAFVDTDDAFHTYKIIVGTFGDITVEYDGVPTLIGSTYTDSPDNGGTPRVLWGMASNLSLGEAEWESISYQAGPEAVPSMGNPMYALLAGMLLWVAYAGIDRGYRTAFST